MYEDRSPHGSSELQGKPSSEQSGSVLPFNHSLRSHAELLPLPSKNVRTQFKTVPVFLSASTQDIESWKEYHFHLYNKKKPDNLYFIAFLKPIRELRSITKQVSSSDDTQDRTLLGSRKGEEGTPGAGVIYHIAICSKVECL